eukprot:g29540.t1
MSIMPTMPGLASSVSLGPSAMDAVRRSLLAGSAVVDEGIAKIYRRASDTFEEALAASDRAAQRASVVIGESLLQMVIDTSSPVSPREKHAAGHAESHADTSGDKELNRQKEAIADIVQSIDATSAKLEAWLQRRARQQPVATNNETRGENAVWPPLHLSELMQKRRRDLTEQGYEDGNGEISKTEFTKVMTHLTQFNKKFSEQQLETLFDAADTDKDGAIQYEELCSWLCDTPCFSRYFQELDKIEKEYHRRLHTTTKGDASVMREEDSSEWMASLFDKRLRPIVKEVFNSADKDKNGVLTEEESILLFKLLGLQCGWPLACCLCQPKRNMSSRNYAEKLISYAMSIMQTEKSHWIHENHWLDKKSLKQLVPSMKAVAQKQLASYESHVDDRNEEAFKVMDRNHDGKLVFEEVEQCLTPGTYRYREFHKALRLFTPEAFKDQPCSDECWSDHAFRRVLVAPRRSQETFDAMATESGDRARRKSDPQIQLLVAQGD